MADAFRPSELMRRTARYVESHPIDLGSLRAGPLGEALTLDELRLLADDRRAVNELVANMLQSADAMEAVNL